MNWLDRLLNIDTSGWNEWTDSSRHSLEYHRNEPTEYPVLDLLLHRYSLNSDDHIVDIGCGKGRALFYLAKQTGCLATGVEYNERVYDHLYNNLKSFGQEHQEVANIHIVQQAAETFRFKPDQSVVYFFNPFSIKIFKEVIEHLIQSINQYPREVDIIMYYPHPEYINYLREETPFLWLDTVNINHDFDERERIEIFRMIPIE